MTTENAATTETAAAVAEQGAHVAPEKASTKKTASPKNSVQASSYQKITDPISHL